MFRRLLSYQEAKDIVQQHLKPKPLGTQEIPLLQAHNRVLAQDAIAELDIPPFDRSTVDGYAVQAQDTYGADETTPLKLRVVGSVAIGETPHIQISKGEAAEIVTGAPIPEGANAVVMLEDTSIDGTELNVYSSVTANENIMKKGSDIKNGQVTLKAGTVLGAPQIGVLAAIGMANVNVYRVPCVAVLSTGPEVTEPGKELLPGKIYDINAYSLCAAVLESDANPLYRGVVPDNETELRQALQNALASADMVITSGGVSVGPKDLTPQIAGSLGKPGIIFSGVALKPGKPVTLSLIEEKPIFSLPGHPAAALLTFHLFVRPIIQAMAGRPLAETESLVAVSGARLFSAKGRRTFTTVQLRRDAQGKLIADPVESGASGAITTLSKADGYVEIPENVQFIDIGEEVKVWLFKGNK